MIILVGGLEHVLFPIIYGIILPIDYDIFQRGWNHQPDYHPIINHYWATINPLLTIINLLKIVLFHVIIYSLRLKELKIIPKPIVDRGSEDLGPWVFYDTAWGADVE